MATLSSLASVCHRVERGRRSCDGGGKASGYSCPFPERWFHQTLGVGSSFNDNPSRFLIFSAHTHPPGKADLLFLPSNARANGSHHDGDVSGRRCSVVAPAVVPTAPSLKTTLLITMSPIFRMRLRSTFGTVLASLWASAIVFWILCDRKRTGQETISTG